MSAGGGIQNNIVFSDQPDFSGATVPASINTITLDNQIWLGRTAVVGSLSQIDVMTLTAGAGVSFTRLGAGVPGVPGTLTIGLSGGGIAADSFAMQTGTSPVVPTAGGLVTFNGAAVAAGTNPVRTNGTGANTMQLEVQRTQAIATTDATKVGLASFDSASFGVDANGFVTSTGGITPASQYEIFDDFIFVDAPSLNSGGTFACYGIFCVKCVGNSWTHTNALNHPGILSNTSTAATDKYISSSNGTAYMGPQAGLSKFTFEWMAKIDFLSAANPNYQLAQGMWDNPSAVPELGPIDGMYFLYNHAVNGGNFQLITRASGVSTVTNTASAADTAWHRYKIIINAAGTSVSFYIDNVEVTGSPVVTNIPTTQMLYQYGIHATAGTNAKGFHTDYWYTKFEFTR